MAIDPGQRSGGDAPGTRPGWGPVAGSAGSGAVSGMMGGNHSRQASGGTAGTGRFSVTIRQGREGGRGAPLDRERAAALAAPAEPVAAVGGGAGDQGGDRGPGARGRGEGEEDMEGGSGVPGGRAQLTGLAEDLAAWTGDFYAGRSRDAEEEEQPDSDVIMMQGDGKGIAMRPEHRRNAGKGDGTRPGIKKMAEIVAVADFTPAVREPQDIAALPGRARAIAATRAPVAAKTRASARPRHPGLADMDKAVTYLTNNHMHMKYDRALAKGWPIATGMIEGACRFVIEDRFGITGARWSPDGAEVILKIRAVVVNGDLHDYMNYYKERYRADHHLAHYDQDTIDRPHLTAYPNHPHMS